MVKRDIITDRINEVLSMEDDEIKEMLGYDENKELSELDYELIMVEGLNDISEEEFYEVYNS